MRLITKIRKRIADGHRVLIHCYGGLGRAVLVAACLVMTIDEDVFTDEVNYKQKMHYYEPSRNYAVLVGRGLVHDLLVKIVLG